MSRRRLVIGHLSLIIFLFLAGCAKKAISLIDVLPGANVIPGWTVARAVEAFDSGTIYDLVDGQADGFFAYGFEQVAVQRYQNADGVLLGVEVWQLAAPADAYGLFTVSVAGDPIAVGNEGDTDPGRRIAFWQDRYYVSVTALQAVSDADLLAFAQAVSVALPPGGERPALVNRLPREGLVARGWIFFHEELSIQDRLWLGGENILGLSQETAGVLAQYDLGGAMVQLLLVEYPGAAQAAAGLAALQGGDVDGLVVADARGSLLGAVVGEVDVTTADRLLSEPLGDR
jgi:hypothetical protein